MPVAAGAKISGRSFPLISAHRAPPRFFLGQTFLDISGHFGASGPLQFFLAFHFLSVPCIARLPAPAAIFPGTLISSHSLSPGPAGTAAVPAAPPPPPRMRGGGGGAAGTAAVPAGARL